MNRATVRVPSSCSRSSLAGTLLDFESDMGIDTSPTLPMLGVQWWFADRHALDLAYFELSRNGRRVIDLESDEGDAGFCGLHD
jgi:hypothetical protein